jgi:hypothetical protein
MQRLPAKVSCPQPSWRQRRTAKQRHGSLRGGDRAGQPGADRAGDRRHRERRLDTRRGCRSSPMRVPTAVSAEGRCSSAGDRHRVRPVYRTRGPARCSCRQVTKWSSSPALINSDRRARLSSAGVVDHEVSHGDADGPPWTCSACRASPAAGPASGRWARADHRPRARCLRVSVSLAVSVVVVHFLRSWWAAGRGWPVGGVRRTR